MKLPLLVIALVFVFFTSSCAVVTPYGKEPEKIGNNKYSFKLYYNLYYSDGAIDNKAMKIVNEIKTKNGHKSCRYDRGKTRPWTGRQSVVYNVSCT